MSADRLLSIGIVGTVLAALCCFTPILVIALGALGLSAWIGGLDAVLLPALLIFILITVYALWKRQKRHRTNLGNHVSALRPQIHRDDADRRLSWLSPLYGVWQNIEARERRMLRLLFIRNGALS